ncbi:MAG: hypothetical protein ABR509_02280 [Candidatus Limnocylindria bacterium]
MRISGGGDDAVSVSEYRLVIALGPNGYVVERGEMRDVCRRDVADGVCV